ncbi:hypothetical protein BT93_J1151 [Corymbia citriodora subsp. variegata]|nr:hypothetical protein BT93_J1151 [Corymbia citriodora subsp. variegata]
MELARVQISRRSKLLTKSNVCVAKFRPRMLEHALPPHRLDEVKESAIKASWWNNSEKKRKRRVARYKFYSVEGKFKASFKQGFRWLKRKCSTFARRF